MGAEAMQYGDTLWTEKNDGKSQTFRCVITSDCRYILIIGGSNSKGLTESIYVLDLWAMKWRKSKVFCPFKGIGFANTVLVKNGDAEYLHLVQGPWSHVVV